MSKASWFEKLTLESMGPAGAHTGLVSLPLSREYDPAWHIPGVQSGVQPVGWRRGPRVPRRVLVSLAGTDPLPDRLQIVRHAPTAEPPPTPCWRVTTRISREQLTFTRHVFSDIQSLRGVPASDCTTVESELLLEYAGKTLALQAGATGPRGGPYYWQNVQVDRLWQNAAAEGIRVGGVLYNEDTYLWTDLYLILFANGVVHVAAHFINTKLHIEGYDFQGLPLLRFAGAGMTAKTAAIPRDGLGHDLGLLQLNLTDAAILCGPENPGRLEAVGADQLWYPVSRIFNPQREVPPLHWEPGFARTVRFQFSLSATPPLLAHYRVPGWWYALCGEPWPSPVLPAAGEAMPMTELLCDLNHRHMVRGRFDGGSLTRDYGNDGHAGTGMMFNFYRTGRSACFADALDHCYYWADLAVDHRDFTVHQWIGGWPWKTCAYSKFHDLLFAYLETADPYLLDTLENAAESYWMWFRANWPRCAIGRDAFEIGGWALLWRYLGTEHARLRTLELVRMVGVVLATRSTIGGQIGAGPHPGYHSSLYMTGVCMTSLLEVLDAIEEDPDPASAEARIAIHAMLLRLHRHFNRDDVEIFPSELGNSRDHWGNSGRFQWGALGWRIYAQLARDDEFNPAMARAGLRRSWDSIHQPMLAHWTDGRMGHTLLNPLYCDAFSLGATLTNDGIDLDPLFDPDRWPAQQSVATPWGELTITGARMDDGVELRFQADHSFPVRIHYRARTYVTTSQSALILSSNSTKETT